MLPAEIADKSEEAPGQTEEGVDVTAVGAVGIPTVAVTAVRGPGQVDALPTTIVASA